MANPQAITLADRNAMVRWRDLFTVDPDWIQRQTVYLVERIPEQAPTLLAARLLYVGDPWTRRPGEQGNARRWKISDIEARIAVLREMRYRRDRIYLPVLARFLEDANEPDLVRETVTTIWAIDPPAATVAAGRLGDPRPAENGPRRLPAAQIPAVRQDALKLLTGLLGIAAPETRRALEWALLQARSGERNHALSLIRRGDVPDMLSAAISRLEAERQEAASAGKLLDDDASAGLALACSRIGGDIDRGLAAILVGIAVNGPREIAAPAATALASNLNWTATVPVDAIAKRARSDADPVIRHALMNLVLRVNAGAGTIDRDGSPWNALSAHRARLNSWEWDQYTK